ncbi:hypothetical protein B1J93_00165 [Leptospira kirschneri serovar Pomona]|uniref:Uncharacterized protein n=1 Tax=Leptospira kirschneri serovar Pomona TaxID=561005 RepID=A0A1T1E5I0_9LEPT|nr:hypothetical protein B1J93_00165 [Leptospira kirschneri serovar Pomona]
MIPYSILRSFSSTFFKSSNEISRFTRVLVIVSYYSPIVKQLVMNIKIAATVTILLIFTFKDLV